MNEKGKRSQQLPDTGSRLPEIGNQEPTLIDPPQTENMEVHHHAHASDPGSHRGRKKWTHYFWEFLMLFLAVFCGFLAEYQLEHKIEHDREKQYMVSMVEDLKKDTGSINKTI